MFQQDARYHFSIYILPKRAPGDAPAVAISLLNCKHAVAVFRFVSSRTGLESNTCSFRIQDIIIPRPLPGDTLKVMRAWLGACQRGAVDTSQHQSYVTLSHRWGYPEPPELLAASISRGDRKFMPKVLTAGIQTGKLSSVTFKVAIRIVRACRLSYIGINSIHIIQDISSQGSNSD